MKYIKSTFILSAMLAVSPFTMNAQVAENETQKAYTADLIEYYRTGDLKLWDKYNVCLLYTSPSPRDCS